MQDKVIDLKLKYQQDKFEAMFKQNADEHKEIKDTLVGITEKLELMVERMDKKYAGKWVEKVLWGAGGIAGTYGVIKVLDLFVK